jgi:hypothetical protein
MLASHHHHQQQMKLQVLQRVRLTQPTETALLQQLLHALCAAR